MSSKRSGLLSNSRRTAARAQPSGSSDDHGAAELPDYEALSCPLDDTAKRELAALTRDRELTRKYEGHLKASIDRLRSSVGAVNERVWERRGELEERQARRRDKNRAEKSNQERLVEEALADLETRVPDLTAQMEASFRKTLDWQGELTDEKVAIEAVINEIPAHQHQEAQPRGAQHRRARQQVMDEDDEDADGDATMVDEKPEVPIRSALQLLEQARARKASAYAAMTMHEKYALHNEYISFKRSLHEAEHPDDDVPLPDASAWFDENGRPNLELSHQAGADDDLVVEREVRSFKCPLSLRTMQEPYSNRKCKHTFEKSVILDFLGNQTKQCPQTGCSQVRRQIFCTTVFSRLTRRVRCCTGPTFTMTSTCYGGSRGPNKPASGVSPRPRTWNQTKRPTRAWCKARLGISRENAAGPAVWRI